MKCDACGKEPRGKPQHFKTFKWKGKTVNVCAECYKREFYDKVTIRQSKDLKQIDIEKPLESETP